MVKVSAANLENIFIRYDIKVEQEATPEDVFNEMAPEEEPWRTITQKLVFLEDVTDEVEKALNKHEPEDVINKGLIPGMDINGELYARGIYYLPQLILAGDAMGKGIELCEDAMASKGRTREAKGKVVMHAAEGDPHDIGKDIAAAMLKAQGYQIIDMGRDVPVEDVVDAVKKENPDVVTGTALMTTTQTAFPRVAKRLQEEGIDVPFIGAGGAVNQSFVHRFPMGIYADEAADGPSICEAVKEGKTWEEIREEYDEIVPSAA
ncbi:Methanogenic corrinoid protein MtaC [Methanonatronarchaeum thermophilum]|uniref:Methanogenic corrinoid protein MtaC n=1 Tax=Methanonatronarchaeum thermophilum TaxID=1927129 RepID=A0A1Y3GA55_9EURY|nr:cobalamin-dependent protein [Methanonatronarchaeum thermophilum]OUJ18147.1 Methanogenic corrinoid protein MtaC [Methanonatronarchaeum thermophilum]